MKILLICGHGDGDPGACACGYKEADLVREYAPTLKKALSQYAEVELHDTSKNLYKVLKNGGSFTFTQQKEGSRSNRALSIIFVLSDLRIAA